MTTTLENLKVAFAGESQARNKYLAFARKAEQDGFANIAKLFRAAAEAETVHALGHFSAMNGIGTTADNLKAAIEGETFEHEQMYPPMFEQAEKEGHRGKAMIGMAMKAEKVHAELYKRALEAVLAGEDLSETEFYYCPVCGHVEIGKPTQRCPICGLMAEKYKLMA
ncbi:MAG: rubrerythrin family protein [Cystobacterineae bacterium]|nr:rubrerythrin family protein [Cystobacterineae bacterium]